MKRFKKVYIEITNICNLRCNFCPGTCRPLEMMDEARFAHVLQAIRPYTDYIYFHLMGEPLLNPTLGKFLEMSWDAGLKVNITTNGTLLGQTGPVLLCAPALRQVNISLASFEANAITKPLKTYLTEVAGFVKNASESSSIICAIRLWNMDTDLLKGSNQFNDQMLRFLESCLDLPAGSLPGISSKNSGVKLKERVFLHLAEKFQWPDLQDPREDSRVFCHGLRDQMGVLVDGTVVPCCLDRDGNIPLGNLLDTSLANILNSDRAIALFNGFSRRCAVELLCKKCSYARQY